eukprot:1194304-Prorocentrum_minimum.AAC.2
MPLSNCDQPSLRYCFACASLRTPARSPSRPPTPARNGRSAPKPPARRGLTLEANQLALCLLIDAVPFRLRARHCRRGGSGQARFFGASHKAQAANPTGTAPPLGLRAQPALPHELVQLARKRLDVTIHLLHASASPSILPASASAAACSSPSMVSAWFLRAIALLVISSAFALCAVSSFASDSTFVRSSEHCFIADSLSSCNCLTRILDAFSAPAAVFRLAKSPFPDARVAHKEYVRRVQRLVRCENIPARPASDWLVVRIYRPEERTAE